MGLDEVPLTFALIGLVLYTVLAGADFGAGFWQLTAGSRNRAASIREHTYGAIGPVWEANHVWLIFVLTVVWTAYPVAFASIASTLTLPLFIAAIGIIFRGVGYALHSGSSQVRERRVIDTVFSLSSVLTPFALGAAVGGIASGRVPVGNAAGDMLTSWLNPTSVLLGVLAVVVAAFLSAIYLSADAVRLGEPDLQRAFRRRALGAAVVAGGVAIGGLLVVRADAADLYVGLTAGDGRGGLVVSVISGVATLALVWWRRLGAARLTAALAVAAVITGWALAQRPVFLPGMTVAQAAAPDATLVAVIIAVLGGALIIFPSLTLLFRLVLAGRLDPGQRPVSTAGRASARVRSSPRPWLGASAGVCLLAGIVLLTVAGAGWAHAVGVVALFGFVATAMVVLVPAGVADGPSE